METNFGKTLTCITQFAEILGLTPVLADAVHVAARGVMATSTTRVYASDTECPGLTF